MALTQVKTLGIADDAVTQDKVANDAIDITEIKAGSDGQLISYDASGNPVKIAAGTSGHFLKSQGDASQPVFAAIPASPITALNNATANELVSVGSTTTELDAEANLTFDGNTLSVTGANGDLVKLNSGGTETYFYQDNNEFRIKVDPDNDEGTSIYTVEIDGTLALRLHAGGDIHLGDWSDQSNVYGKARVNIRGVDEIATSFALTGSYLHIGGQESTINGLYPISFGHIKSTSNNASSYIAAKTTNSASYEETALTFATRNVTTDSVPTERSRITAGGSHIHYGHKYGIYTKTGVASHDGGSINVQYLEDALGVWMVVAKIQQSSHMTAAMSSVAQIDVTTGQSTGTEWSSAWGNAKPLAVRYISCSNWDEWGDNRGVDFIHGVPNDRLWQQFFTSGNTSGFQAGDGAKVGWTCDGCYDGKGRWRNPGFTFMRMSDPGAVAPTVHEDFFNTPTASSHANCLNMWGDRTDAKFAVHHSAATGGQDAACTSIYGYDDNVYTHEDSFPSAPANSGGTNLAAMPLWVCLNFGLAQL